MKIAKMREKCDIALLIKSDYDREVLEKVAEELHKPFHYTTKGRGLIFVMPDEADVLAKVLTDKFGVAGAKFLLRHLGVNKFL